uniref:hypothetical protein n=1 Tax=Alistipes shahii TaxID=328814 RepID=UPI003FED40EF
MKKPKYQPSLDQIQSQHGFADSVPPEDCLYQTNALTSRGIDAIEVSGNFFNHKGSINYFHDTADKIACETKLLVIVTVGNCN